MNPSQNYSLLKQSSPQNVTLKQNKQKLKQMIKQRQGIIHGLSKQIEDQRAQMKILSKQINTIIEKQHKKPTKQGPSKINTYINSSKLKKINSELQQAYQNNENIKNQIMNLREDQPQAIAKEIETLNAKIIVLDKQSKRISNNKELLCSELQKNRNRIKDLQQNQCLIELQERQEQYEQVKKQCKQIQKQFNIKSALLLQENSYYHHIKSIIDKQEQVIQTPVEIDPKQIAKLVSQINSMAQQRKHLQRQTDLKKKQTLQHIKELENHIKQRQIMIRQIQKDILRVDLDSKRNINYITQPRKTVKPTKIYKPVNPQKKVTKKQLVNKVYMMQKQQDKTIIVGSWKPQGIIRSDRGQHWQHQVQKTKKITFLHTNNQVVGVRSSYLDINQSLIQGRTILPEGIHSFSELEVLFQDVLTIQYANSENSIYLRFILKNGTNKQVGSKQISSTVERISLQQYIVKWVQVQLNDNLIGLRISLDNIPTPQKLLEDETPENNQLTQRSFSNSGLYRKRVLVKGGSLSKLKQTGIVDHRLMLGKNKKI